MKKKLIILIPLTLMLSSCSREFIEDTIGVDYTPTNRFAKNLAPLPGQFVDDTKELKVIKQKFSKHIVHSWGQKQVKMSSSNEYVKYSDGYNSRSDVDFAHGKVRVETVSATNPEEHLKKAIVMALLTPEDPQNIDLFSDADVEVGQKGQGKPFLYNQVLDQDGKPIEWHWRANRFAQYLVTNKMKVHRVGGKTSYYVDIPMDKNHEQVRSYKYASLVKSASERYGIPEDLIYGIIKTESSFNPYAVSWAKAYGLMQIIPKTAGADVFKLVKNRGGQPTARYLYNPANNIDTGTAYFYLLKNRYLKDIRDPLSKEYSMISSYNGGAGGVFNTFSSDRKRAVSNINSLKPNQVYWALTKKHKNAESRRYLEKVTNYRKEFFMHKTS